MVVGAAVVVSENTSLVPLVFCSAVVFVCAAEEDAVEGADSELLAQDARENKTMTARNTDATLFFNLLIPSYPNISIIPR